MKFLLIILLLFPTALLAQNCLTSRGYAVLTTNETAEITISAKDTPVAWACTAVVSQDPTGNLEGTTTGTIIVRKIGRIAGHYNACFTNGIAATYHWGVYKNGVLLTCSQACDSPPALGSGSCNGIFCTTCALDDVLNLKVMNLTNTDNPIISHACLRADWTGR